MKTKVLLLCTLFLAVVGGVKAQSFSDGDGTQQNPYIISSREDFNSFAQLVNNGTGDYASKYYQLGGDIDYDGCYDYVPVGTSDHPFTGTFDGKGYIVDGPQMLTSENGETVRDFAREYTGLFGYVGIGGVVKNVKVENPYIK